MCWKMLGETKLERTASLSKSFCGNYRNSTEETKLAPDHLLTAPSFSLRMFQFIIYSERRSRGLIDFI